MGESGIVTKFATVYSLRVWGSAVWATGREILVICDTGGSHTSVAGFVRISGRSARVCSIVLALSPVLRPALAWEHAAVQASSKLGPASEGSVAQRVRIATV